VRDIKGPECTKWRICYWEYGSDKRSGRTKTWAKSLVSSKTEAQRLADQFMETANERNNQPQLFPFGKDSLASLVAVCREKMWPLLKNSTTISYDFNLDTYILPTWGSMRITKLRTIELQDFFNSFSPRLSPKTIRNMHGCLRAILSQGKAWGLVRMNPAQGVRLPDKKARKPPVVLSRQGYPPCHRGSTRTDTIHRHLDRRRFVADRRGYRTTLGKNSPGSNRLGSGPSAEIQVIWYSPTHEEDR
jgi:hypothetical protein